MLDEGVLFRTNETAFVQTKRKLLDECNVYCIVSLPGGVFTAAGAGVKTNLLFFNKGEPTEKIWYYDLSDVKVGKRQPFTLDKFDEFFRLLPKTLPRANEVGRSISPSGGSKRPRSRSAREAGPTPSSRKRTLGRTDWPS